MKKKWRAPFLAVFALIYIFTGCGIDTGWVSCAHAELYLPHYQTVSEGYYLICSKKFDVYTVNGLQNDENVMVGYDPSHETASHFWRIIYLGEGLYCIENYDSGRFLGVSDQGNGDNVVHTRWARPQDWEKWYIAQEDDCIYFVPYCKQWKALDIDGGALATSTNIQVWDQNRTDAQQFVLKAVDYSGLSQMPVRKYLTFAADSALYSIKPVLDTNYALGVTSDSLESVHLRNYDSMDKYQAWTISYIGDGLYTILNYGSGCYLDVSLGGWGDDVLQCNDGDVYYNEKWYLVPENDYFYFVPYCKLMKALDVYGGETYEGNNIGIWEQNYTDAQKFYLTGVSPNSFQLQVPTSATITDGYYSIQSDIDANYCIGTSENNVVLRRYASNSKNQIWRFVYLYNGLYYIQHAGSDSFLSVNDNGNNLIIHHYGPPNDNEKWYVVEAGNGRFYLVPYTRQNKTMDIDNGVMQDGTGILLWNQQKSENQRMILKKLIYQPGMFHLPSSDLLTVFGSQKYYIRELWNNQCGIAATGNNNRNITLHNLDYSNPYHQWEFIYYNSDGHNGAYLIKNVGSGKYLCVDNSGDGGDVWMYYDGIYPHYLWYVVYDSAKGGYCLIPYCTPDKAITPEHNNIDDGADLYIGDQENNWAQRFELKHVFSSSLFSLGTVAEGGGQSTFFPGLGVMFGSGSDGGGSTLQEGKDYVIDSTTINADGTMTVAAHGIGDYAGEAEWTVSIPQKSVIVFFNDPKNPGIESRTLTTGKPYGDLPVPTCQGYEFDGWFLEDTLITAETIVLSDDSLSAHWTPKDYTLSFDAAGGTVEEASRLVTYDQPYGSLPIPERIGYDFDGWYIGDSKIESDTLVQTAEDHTATARWTPITMDVELDPCGGKVTPKTVKVEFDGLYGALPVPARDGYAFIGWFSADESIRITESTRLTALSMNKLYAQWKTFIQLPEGLEIIEEGAFEENLSIEMVQSGQKLRIIQNRAFRSCKNLTDIWLPDTVVSIAPDAFEGCEALTIHCSRNSAAWEYAKQHQIAADITD